MNLPLSGFTVGVSLPNRNQVFTWTYLLDTTTQTYTHKRMQLVPRPAIISILPPQSLSVDV